ncbi:MAG: ferrous iron transport protein B [Candidatus Hermodarchaeota archaeon]
MSCHLPKPLKQGIENRYKDTINIALAGNPNVGKSVIFNQLTGLSQTIGNWPGKTVEKMEGYLDFQGFHFNIVDLPGIYSLSTYSIEEIVSREFIISDDVDIIINVIDATNLERNLFFTFQLLELNVPMILAINQMDILHKRHMDIDFEQLKKIFKLPIISLVAIHGVGIHQLLEKAIEMVKFSQPHLHYKETKIESWKHHPHHYHKRYQHHYHQRDHIHRKVKSFSLLKSGFEFPDLSNILSFGKEVEKKIKELIDFINANKEIYANNHYPLRFLAIKLLENDEEIKKLFINHEQSSKIIHLAENLRSELEEIHGEDISTIVSSEIYNNINKVTQQVLIIKSGKQAKRISIADKIDHITTHSIFGYIILILVIFGIYLFTFTIGDFLGGLFDAWYGFWSERIYSIFGENSITVKIFWDGGMGGLVGAIGGVLVYVIPFFFVIEILQDSGYLPRAAFLMDRIMHSIGVHGKTIIPMILGFGCNVPACAGCRIMETEREKKISIVLTSLIPCAATMTVVMGLVGRYLGLGWVTFLFVINFSVILIVGRILNKTMPGTCTELIMEMHEYRMPNYNVIAKQTWLRTKEFVFRALPIIVILGIFLEILLIFNALEPINFILYPISVLWLGLPAAAGIFLIYGILRKELTLVLLALFAENLGLTLLELLTPIQMIVFSLVTMLYIPCFATIIIIAKQTNWKYALKISALEIGLALLIGGIINWGFFLFSSL